MRTPTVILLLALSGATATLAETPGTASSDPLWEVGLFTAVADWPLYRGSDESKFYVLPLPFLIYRGKILHADRDGVRGLFLRTERLETALSFSLNPPADSGDGVRKGMPDLDALVGAGPALKWFFAGRTKVRYVYLDASARGVCSADIDPVAVEYEGLQGGAALVYRDLAVHGDDRLRFGFNAGIEFGDQDYNSYVYDVADAYATPGRPAYESRGGYGGFSLSMNLVRRINRRFSLGGYYRWVNISGASFADSPLVERLDNHIFGAALIWRMAESQRLADEEFTE
jgi:MipA family protein